MPILITPRAQLHYRLDGPEAAPVIVLSTSLGSSLGQWDRVVPELVRHLRVLRYDHRGHGGSPPAAGPYTLAELAGDVVDLLDGLGISRASFCGISLGGMIGLWLAAHAPARLDRLVAACTSAQFPAEPFRERAALARARGVAATLDAAVPRWFTPAFAAAEPAEVARLAALVAACSLEGYTGACDAVAGADLRADLPDIAVPTLVLGARADVTSPPAESLAIASAIPGAALLVLGDAAHIACAEQPRRFAAAVLEHVTGTQTDRGLAVRRAVLGDAYVSASLAKPFTADFQDLITRYAWGDLWSRPGLDRRTRSAITVAMLIARNRPDELALHLRGARRNGLSDAELTEILLHAAIYCGVPAANAAFAVAQRVLAED